MPKRAEHDFAVNAFKIVEQAIGERMDGTPLVPPKDESPSAKRGHARAAKLTSAQRVEIAKKGAAGRWSKK